VILLLTVTLARADENATPIPEPTGDPIPEAVALIDEGDQDILNILLIGAATTNPNNPGLTDSLMIVSINRTAGAVSLVSIPRDLFVNVPGFGMNKINTAYFYGEMNVVEGGGLGVLKDTIRYNLGLQIDFYARINFTGFGRLIDELGGIAITVDCTIRDWKLISPELDKQVPENYELYTLRPGLRYLDGELALWYVRSRRTSSDLDRGRRQQDVLRAIWRKIRQEGILQNLPRLWDDLEAIVQTDMTLADMLGLLPLANQTETSDLRYFLFRQRHEVVNAYSAAGQAVLMPQAEAVQALMQNVVLPPTSARSRVQRPTVAVINASEIPGLAAVAADRLELEGFETTLLEEPTSYRRYNHIIDYTGAARGNPIGRIQDVLRVTEDGVEVMPDAERDYDYRVYIGWMYQYWSCTRDVIQPPVGDETPTPMPEGG
jgi:LCP family protein required for cell wall assembly